MSEETYFATVALPFVLAREGGRVDDPADPGGRTNLGVTQKTWDLWRLIHPELPADVWDATATDVAPLYAQDYWHAAGAADLPDGASLAVFDTAVNVGVARAVRWWVATLDVAAFLATRRAYYRQLAADHAQLAKFLPGWLKRVDLLEEAIV